jgi:hypothetical protein
MGTNEHDDDNSDDDSSYNDDSGSSGSSGSSSSSDNSSTVILNDQTKESSNCDECSGPPKSKKRARITPRNVVNNVQTRPSTIADKKQERIIPLKPDELFVNWGDLISTKPKDPSKSWIKEPFMNHILPVIEVDKLIGYATHISTYHQPSSTSSSLARSGRKFHNPLLGLPNIPLRPTLLKHLILDPATKLTAAYIQQQRKVADDDSGDDDENLETDKKRRKKPKKATTTSNITKRQASHPLYERFHHTASIVIGMFVEEMITAALLPLARRHVKECRRNSHDNNHRLWTVPPEEAIMNLYHAESDRSTNSRPTSIPALSSSSSLLTTRIPTRSIVSGAIGTSIINQPAVGTHERLAYNKWCTSRCVPHQKKIIENDSSFFQLLIQNIPSTVQYTTPATTTTTTTAEARPRDNTGASSRSRQSSVSSTTTDSTTNDNDI